MNQVPVTDTLFNANGQRIAIIDSYREIVGGNFHMLSVFTTIDSLAYRYRFMTTGSGKYDAWGGSWIQLSNFSTSIPTTIQYPAIQDYVMPDSLQTIVSSWNCSEKVISVANMRNRKGYITKNNTYYQPASTTPVGKLSENSSKGPARNGTTKPDITAAGDVTLAAGPIWYLNNPANNTTIDVGSFHVRNGGTSMASPVVAGIAALYLQKCPLSTYQQFKIDLNNTAIVDAATGQTPNFGYGFGKADALGLLSSKNIPLGIDPILGICIGSTATLHVSSLANLNTALWSNGTVGLSMTTAIVGSYYVKCLDSAGCYTRSTPVALGTLMLPFVDAGASFSSCPGEEISLLGTGTALTYTWDNGVANNQAFTPLSNATYYVTGTASNGCQNTDSITVNLYDVDPVSYNETNTTVMEGSGPFNVAPGLPSGGIYSGLGIIGTSFHPTLTGPGSFYVTYSYTDGNGCANSDSSLIEVVDLNHILEGMTQPIWLSPNPASEWLTIHGLTASTTITIIDLSGRVLLRRNSETNEATLNVQGLTNGMYLIEVNDHSIPWIKN